MFTLSTLVAFSCSCAQASTIKFREVPESEIKSFNDGTYTFAGEKLDAPTIALPGLTGWKGTRWWYGATMMTAYKEQQPVIRPFV